MPVLRLTGCLCRPGANRRAITSPAVARRRVVATVPDFGAILQQPADAVSKSLKIQSRETASFLSDKCASQTKSSELATGRVMAVPSPGKRTSSSWDVTVVVLRVFLIARRIRLTKNCEPVPACSTNTTQSTSNQAASGHSEVEVVKAVTQMLFLLEPGQSLGYLSDFAKEYADDVFCRRLLRKTNMNIKKSTDKLKQALEWREKHQKLLTEREFALGSDERVIGKDLECRPVLYMCLKNQMLAGSKCLDQKVVTMVQAIENMPPGVEKTVHIWDMHGQQFRISDLNPAPLVSMVQSQETYFAERLHELVIIGMPKMARTLKDAIWPAVPEKTKAKIKFLSDEEARDYLSHTCPLEVADRIHAAMRENRDGTLTLEQRKKNWQRVNEFGLLVSLA